jgi:hypothetical protein
MTQVWTDTRLMFQRLGAYDKPALVNLEPDFWGFMLRAANGNPATVAAKVTIASECAGLTNDLKGVAGCMLAMARTHAPKARVGFPPSDWEFTAAQNIAWFKALGADRADFVVMQTLDRDAGCFELGAATCTGISPGPWYWDAAAYARHFALAKSYHDGLGLPLLWWQTPMGVPASGSGSVNRYRDNRVDHFLTHPAEVVAAGGFAVVFGAGADTQTAIPTDGGQFQRLSAAYLANPAALP